MQAYVRFPLASSAIPIWPYNAMVRVANRGASRRHSARSSPPRLRTFVDVVAFAKARSSVPGRARGWQQGVLLDAPPIVPVEGSARDVLQVRPGSHSCAATDLPHGRLPTGEHRAVVTREWGRLLRLALDLGADRIGGAVTDDERRLLDVAHAAEPTPRHLLDETRAAIRAGADPLGDELCRVWQPSARRAAGAFYTPAALVAPMLDWALAQEPQRLVDPGCGSGRFATGAVRRRPDIDIVAIDLDPVATLLTRAALATLGAQSATVRQADYTAIALLKMTGEIHLVGAKYTSPSSLADTSVGDGRSTSLPAISRSRSHTGSASCGSHCRSTARRRVRWETSTPPVHCESIFPGGKTLRGRWFSRGTAWTSPRCPSESTTPSTLLAPASSRPCW